MFLDYFTCSFVLKAYAALSGALNGRIVHGHVEKLGFRLNLFLQNMIVHLYASCGTMGDTRLSFDKMSQRS